MQAQHGHLHIGSLVGIKRTTLAVEDEVVRATNRCRTPAWPSISIQVADLLPSIRRRPRTKPSDAR